MTATPALPLFVELLTRAQNDPVERPDWEKYWNFVIILPPAYLEIILVLVQCYRHYCEPLPVDILHPLPGGKGVALNTERSPPLLQQIVLHYLNQVDFSAE